MVVCGCVGSIGDTEGVPGRSSLPPEGSAELDVSFACDPSAAPVPTGLRRLSKAQLGHSVRDALAMLVPAQAAAIAQELAQPLAAVPDDVLGGDTDYRSMVQSLGQTHVDAYYALGRAFGAALVGNATRRNALLGACATDATTANDSACIDSVIRRVGRVLFRRPLSEPEATLYRSIYDAPGLDTEALAEAMAALAMAPPFLYLIELGASVRDNGQRIYDLTPYELASRLSYHFWQSLPDEALLDAAEDGSLTTEAGYRAQVDRLFAAPKARRTTEAFYGEWLKLDAVPAMHANASRPDFAAYAGADLPSPQLRARLITDVQDLAAHYTFAVQGGTLADLFSSTASFARTSDVAALYGNVPLWDGTTAPPSHVQPERVGILSRAAMLANNQATTRPIQRGVLVLRRLLCEDIELPENMMAIMLELSDGTQTTRERITELSQAPGSTCNGCHTAINPLGFVAERFDALGRVRTSERVYAPTGELLANLPIDTRVETTLDAGPERTFDSVAQMSQAIVDSGRVQACFARHYVRFTFGRHEDLSRDGCLLENLRQHVAGAGSLSAMFKNIAFADGFKRVRKPE